MDPVETRKTEIGCEGERESAREREEGAHKIDERRRESSMKPR